jgi:hypothetical protein
MAIKQGKKKKISPFPSNRPEKCLQQEVLTLKITIMTGMVEVNGKMVTVNLLK